MIWTFYVSLVQLLRRAARLSILFVLLACVFSAEIARAGSPPWAEAYFSYYSRNGKLDEVLKDFASSFSLALNLGPEVNGVVNGRFNTATPTDFINKLGSVYGFDWFVYSGTLFVSRADRQKTTAISAASSSTSQLREALIGLNILNTRFGWGELPDQGVVVVSGPPAYVDLVERTVKALPAVTGGQQVAIFRLKYTSVSDRTMYYRDKEIVTPGLATILRNLLVGGSGTGRNGNVNNEALAAIAAPLRSAPPTFGDSTGVLPSAASGANAAAPGGVPGAFGSGAAASKPAMAGGVRMRTPSIEADVRMNSLIIQDIPERLPVYERLIRELDVPTDMIEIQAMIIDVNSERISELGIDWGVKGDHGAVGYGRPTNVMPAGTMSMNFSSVKDAVNPTTLILDTGNYLITRIRILEGEGDARVLSRPSVLTQDNQGALFDNSETFYVKVEGERVASVTPITAGTSLRVTPRIVDIGGKKVVQLLVDVEDGNIDRLKKVDELPTVRRSGISTQALVGENEALVIGGYNNEQESQRNDGVPVLGSIPLIGALFSYKTAAHQKRERLFIIKPRIISTSAQSLATIPPQAREIVSEQSTSVKNVSEQSSSVQSHPE